MKTRFVDRITSGVKGLLLFYLFTFLPLNSLAQGEEFTFVKGGCLPDISDEGGSHRASRRLPARKTDWDATKTYRQMGILFTFSDQDFSMENPKEYYDKLFNQEGFNEGKGPGCVADYYKAQSGGKANFQFDIYGPVQVNFKACPYDAPTDKTRNYGNNPDKDPDKNYEPIKEATQLILEANPTVDYSQYDWNGDGYVEQVIYVYAGTPGNTASTYGCIWPNTSTFSTIEAPGGINLSAYTASGECWGKNNDTPVYCGLGTICHEFTHSLGLPDIYPVPGGSNYPYSSVDEWDLMDGGNFTNWGWCPPNFSSLEKMLMGWLTPVELTEPTTVMDMKPVSEGGAVYQIKHTDTEYLLLENRQWTGWDAGLPGKGLVVFYVNYQQSAWSSNSVNSFMSEDQFRYKLIHADNMTYAQWDAYIQENKLSSYLNSNRMNRRYLSTSPYPTESNNELTDKSMPVATMTDKTALSKPITNIQMTDEGWLSFEFMSNEITKLVEGEESYKGGMVSKSITPVDGKKTLTISPNNGYYLEANNIKIVRTSKEGTTRLLRAGEETVEVNPVDASADPSGVTSYTYPYTTGYNYQIVVDFQNRIDLAKEETKTVITLDATNYEYDGTEKKPAITSVTYGDAKTSINADSYEISYVNNKDAGTAEVHISGKRHFIGDSYITFSITPKDITGKVSISAIEDQDYTGEEIKPEPVVKYGDIKLEKDKDYEMSYGKNINIGTATIEFTFKGNYQGTADTTFKIQEPTGIITPHVILDTDSSIYDLSGQRVYIPLPGNIYIVKKNGIIKKIVAKP